MNHDVSENYTTRKVSLVRDSNIKKTVIVLISDTPNCSGIFDQLDWVNHVTLGYAQGHIEKLTTGFWLYTVVLSFLTMDNTWQKIDKLAFKHFDHYLMYPSCIQETINKKVQQVQEWDDILGMIGSQGRYQKKLLHRFILPFSFMMPFFILNNVFMLAEPDHWCHVQGREETNLTAEAWKNLTIPIEIGHDGESRFSQCSMYGEYPDPDKFYQPNASRMIIYCISGWKYDRSEYRETIPTENDWVCENSENANHALMVYYAGNIVGAILFGWAGDWFGRKHVFILSTGTNLIFRLISLHVTEYYSWFLLMQFLVGTGFPVMYITVVVILSEISGKEFRSWIFACFWSAWILGTCLLPIIAWVFGEWYSFGLITSLLAGASMCLCWKMVPESPRWLLTVGSLKEAESVLLEISEANETFENFQSGALKRMLMDLKIKQEDERIEQSFPFQIQGFWTLLSRGRIAKYTGLLGLTWFVTQLVHQSLALNTSLVGNQFANFFLLSAIELPTGICGRFLIELFGRRWTQVGLFALCAIGLIISVIGIYISSPAAVLLVAIASKFLISTITILLILRGTEIFPTELRVTGMALTSSAGSISYILAMYAVHLGRAHAALPYLCMALLSVVGMTSASLLPETLRQNLHETLETSNSFGKSVEFWSFLPREGKGTGRRKPPGSDYASTVM